MRNPKRPIIAPECEKVRKIKKHSSQALELATYTPAEMLLGRSDNLGDREWRGRKSSVDVDAIVRDGLSPYSPLEELLLAIIDAHEKFRAPSTDKLRKKTVRQYRLEHAMHFLTGAQLTPGPGRGEQEVKLELVAELYFNGKLGLTADKGKYLDTVLADVFFPKKKLRADDRTNRLKGPRAEFLKNKDRLLIKISARGVAESRQRKHAIAKIVEQLKTLGVKAQIPKG